jgi:hypothetical protein
MMVALASAPVMPGIISADSHITEPAGTYVDHIGVDVSTLVPV